MNWLSGLVVVWVEDSSGGVIIVSGGRQSSYLESRVEECKDELDMRERERDQMESSLSNFLFM